MEPEEFFSVIAIGMVIGSILTLVIQAYGRRKARQASRAVDAEVARKVALLTNMGDQQTGQIDRLQERLAVLERLAVDPAHRTAREIDALR